MARPSVQRALAAPPGQPATSRARRGSGTPAWSGRVSGRPPLGLTAALAAVSLNGCAGWLPDTATEANHARLYQEFYEANLDEDLERADALARRLELCGRQLYLKDEGFLGAMQKQEKHGGGKVTVVEMVDLFSEDACRGP